MIIVFPTHEVFLQLLHIVFCDATTVMERAFVDCEFTVVKPV